MKNTSLFSLAALSYDNMQYKVKYKASNVNLHPSLSITLNTFDKHEDKLLLSRNHRICSCFIHRPHTFVHFP